jgi:hypothetical protein
MLKIPDNDRPTERHRCEIIKLDEDGHLLTKWQVDDREALRPFLHHNSPEMIFGQRKEWMTVNTRSGSVFVLSGIHACFTLTEYSHTGGVIRQFGINPDGEDVS